MGLIEDYFNLTVELKKTHGERSLVLMQNGAFFEIYGLKENDTIVGSNIIDICDHCDLHIADKKVCVNNCDVVQAGFGIREHIVDKYMKKILDYGYTVSVWEQDQKAAGTTRTQTGIYSSGTYFSNDNSQISNNLFCIWIEKHKANIIIGTSNINIYTGKSSIYEYTATYSQSPNTYSDLERLVSIYNPSEVIIIHNLTNREIDDIIQYMSFTNNSIKIINTNDNTQETKQVENCQKQTYQKEILNKFFSNNTLHVENEFNLYETATCSYCYLLNFIFGHNSNLINKISLPVFENNCSKMQLGNHSLKQLNIIDTGFGRGKLSCVQSFLNHCLTAIGRRKFSEILVNPITNSEVLINEYNMIDYCINNLELLTLFKNNLQNIKDLEKLNRKKMLKKITPSDFFVIHDNLQKIIEIFQFVSNDVSLVEYFDNKDIIDNCNTINKEIERVLNISICKNINTCSEFDNNFINKNIDIEHDKTVENMMDSYDKLECIREYLNSELMKLEKTKTKKCIKIHETDKSGYSLTLTKRRGTILKTVTSKMRKPVTLTYFSKYHEVEKKFELDCKSIDYVDSTKQESCIVSNEIKGLYKTIQESKHIMIKSLQQVYMKFIDNMINYSELLENICNFIGKCDVLYCKIYIASKYNYCKPYINDNVEDSFMDIKDLRHPLIESLLHDELYVTNDIYMNNNNERGILLYGTNAVGKSSLIKSIGICIIMAQAGMFVPCTSFHYKPYNSIFTRILGNDNLFKGLSTFAVEMLELKTIIKACDNNTLILGDELCSGTENDSAIGIFIAGINHMYDKKSSFIFATHFHEIVDYEEITSKEQLAIKHMEVMYDKENDTLIYNRKLQDGSGDNMYGLEVCKSLHLPDDFLNDAYFIRNKYSNKLTNILELKQSHYNSKKLMGICELCHNDMSSEVHHLQYQRNADENGFIGTFHKNHLGNLLSVCEKCHNKFHSDKEIKGHKKTKTTNGSLIENL